MKSLAITPRRRRGLILVVAIAALVIYWYHGQNRPEHLKSPALVINRFPAPDPPYQLNENLRNHTLNLKYWTSPATGFKHIASTTLPPGLHFDPMSSRLLGVKGDLIYFTLVKEAALKKISHGGIGVPSFPPTKPIIRHFVTLPSNEMTYVCCFAIKGGVIRTLLACRGINNIAITDDTIYWIDPRPEPITSIEDGSFWISTPTSLLMATSLKTLQTRQVAGNISLYVHLVPDHTSLYLYLRDNVGNQPNTHVWYYSPDLAGPVHLTDNFIRGDGESYSKYNDDKPITLGDCFYWIEDSIEKLPTLKGVHANLEATTWQVVETSVVSVRRDGTQRRMILTLPVVDGSPSVSTFAVYRGRFYLGLTETTRTASKVRETTTICRIDSDSKQPLVRLLSLPDSARVNRIDGGYVYYTVTEDYSSFFGYESFKSEEPYRWKLPD